MASDDTVWISNFAGKVGAARIAHLCGAKTENCPPSMKTGDPISPPEDVWVMNNWQDIASCFGDPVEGLSTRYGGQGVTIFFGMAKPVRAPQIGPVRQP